MKSWIRRLPFLTSETPLLPPPWLLLLRSQLQQLTTRRRQAAVDESFAETVALLAEVASRGSWFVREGRWHCHSGGNSYIRMLLMVSWEGAKFKALNPIRRIGLDQQRMGDGAEERRKRHWVRPRRSAGRPAGGPSSRQPRVGWLGCN